VWEVHKLDGVPTLRSWVYSCFWLPGKIVSDISYTTDGLCEGPIGDDNQRGVWAFKTRQLLHDDFHNYHLGRGLVYGTCYMWGTIIEHELGYRSQYARVLALDTKADGMRPDRWTYDYTADPCGIDLDFLRSRYGVGASEA
jgi:hypothetical protein